MTLCFIRLFESSNYELLFLRCYFQQLCTILTNVHVYWLSHSKTACFRKHLTKERYKSLFLCRLRIKCQENRVLGSFRIQCQSSKVLHDCTSHPITNSCLDISISNTCVQYSPMYMFIGAVIEKQRVFVTSNKRMGKSQFFMPFAN